MATSAVKTLCWCSSADNDAAEEPLYGPQVKKL
jgi:hypothetical protein